MDLMTTVYSDGLTVGTAQLMLTTSAGGGSSFPPASTIACGGYWDQWGCWHPYFPVAQPVAVPYPVPVAPTQQRSSSSRCPKAVAS